MLYYVFIYKHIVEYMLREVGQNWRKKG